MSPTLKTTTLIMVLSILAGFCFDLGLTGLAWAFGSLAGLVFIVAPVVRDGFTDRK